MPIAPSGTRCLFCCCGNTVLLVPQSWQRLLSIVLPCVLCKCPHCLGRFWRFNWGKFSVRVGVLSALATGGYYLLKL